MASSTKSYPAPVVLGGTPEEQPAELIPNRRTVVTAVRQHDVVRCQSCMLVQYRTISDSCRRCSHPLTPVPHQDAAPESGRLTLLAQNGSQVGFSPDGHLQMDLIYPRGKTTREIPIGRRMRQMRKQRHLTQQDIARRTGLPRTYISRIENERLLPGPQLVGRLATALGVAIPELLPPNGNGNGRRDTAASPFWKELVKNFSLLNSEEMSRALFFARTMADQNGRHDLVAKLAVS